MSFQLSEEIIKSAKEYLALFDRGTRTRGQDYFASGRVVKIEKAGEGSWFAVVRGGEDYEVVLEYDDQFWTGDCTCPVESDCKHVYAAMKHLLKEVEKEQKPAAVSAGPKKAKRKAAGKKTAEEDLAFRDLAARRLGRELSAVERQIAVDVQQIYTRYRSAIAVPEYMLHRLCEGFHPYSWKEVKIWPGRPKDVWEAWLYIAYALRSIGRRIPAFLEQLAPESEIREALGEWVRSHEVDRWRKLLSKLTSEETAPAPKPKLDLRVVLDGVGVRLEYREGGADWAVVKKTRHDQMARAYSLDFANVESRLIWAAFQKGEVVEGLLGYGRANSHPGIEELLRNPILTDRLFWETREPLRRAEERLVWRIREPDEADGDYKLALALPDGTPPPEPLLCLEGNPTLYLTIGAMYEASPVWRLNPSPSAGNLIPAKVLESSAGVQLLERVGAPMPERFSSKVRVLKPQLIIEGSLDANWEVEHLEVRFLADWGDAAPMEVYSSDGWRRMGKAAKQKDGAGPIVHFERGSLAAVPGLTLPLALNCIPGEEVWTRKLNRNFPEQFSAWLQSLPANAELRLTPELASLGEAPVTGEFRLEVESSGVDWFDVETTLSVSEIEFSKEELRMLLNAKGGWVRLGQKGWRKLALKWSDEDEEKLADLGLSSQDINAGPQRFHALQLSGASAKSLLPAEHYEAVYRRAEEIKTRVSPPLPQAITAELRPYQVEGFHFLAYLSTNRFGGVLADDMGLGKTLQTLTWLAWLRTELPQSKMPSLVVCPKSVTANWETEAAKFLPDLVVRVWTKGTPKSLEQALDGADLLVLNYAQLRVMGEELVKRTWLAVILDEAQAIKNPDSQTARAACQLKAEQRLALSGTPVENRLLDLWSILTFAMPGILGQRAKFAKSYEKTGDDPFARRRLAARVRPFLLRRTKEQVAKDLPPRTEEDLLCDLEGKQATLYKAELKRARQMLLKIGTAKQLDKQRFNILTSLLRLRQICCHPVLVDANASGAGSAKMEALLELLEPLMQEGHKVLVFSQFVGVLELVRAELIERGWQYSMLTGETENRGDLVKEFQTSAGARIFLLSLKAGGAGLNLTAASYVVLFDPWWNPAVENQAIDRTHRIGQTEHVNAYRLLIRNTIEEKIRNLQKSKSALAEDILGEEAFARTLTLQDFQFLLGTGDTDD